MPEKADSLKVVQHGGTHYKGLAIEPAEYCQRNRLNNCESNAIKYLSRHHLKGGLEDVKKAIHYVQMVLEFEYGVKTSVIFGDQNAIYVDPQKAEEVRRIIKELQAEEARAPEYHSGLVQPLADLFGSRLGANGGLPGPGAAAS